jgi:hypothetical protein
MIDIGFGMALAELIRATFGPADARPLDGDLSGQ